MGPDWIILIRLDKRNRKLSFIKQDLSEYSQMDSWSLLSLSDWLPEWRYLNRRKDQLPDSQIHSLYIRNWIYPLNSL